MRCCRHSQDWQSWSISWVAVLGLLAGSVLLEGTARSETKSTTLTPEDRSVLATGELVTKPKTETRGALQLFGGQSWQVADVPVETAWRAVEDLANYKRILPLATESKVGKQSGDKADLAIRQQKGPIDVRYVLQTTLDPKRRVMIFRMDQSRSGDLRAGWGFIRVRPWKKERTLISFGIMVDIGDGMFVSMIRPSVRKHMLRIPTRLKRYLEEGIVGKAVADN